MMTLIREAAEDAGVAVIADERSQALELHPTCNLAGCRLFGELDV